MPLSCDCDYDDCGDGPWIEHANNFSVLETINRRACISCGEKISPGDDCVGFRRWRYPKTFVEEKICGEEVAMASQYHCERCGGLYFSLMELGFCIDPYEDMRDLVAEYAEMAKAEREEKRREREAN